MKYIVIGHEKGGVGKSTLSGNIAVGLALRNPGRVILIDADKQQTSAKWGSRRRMASIEPEIPFATLFVERSANEFAATIGGLRQSGSFDYCLMDVGGKDTAELRAALSIADALIVPCLPSQPDVESLAEFEERISEAKKMWNPDLEVLSVISKAPVGIFSAEIQVAVEGIVEIDHFDRPAAIVADRPNFRKAWVGGRSVYDLPDSANVDKARSEINEIVDAL